MAEKRSIFEEVSSSEKPATSAGVIDRAKRPGARGAIRVWLMALFALVVVMIAVGGATRLTDSGLSITEWKPVTGAIPPLSAEVWDEEFEKYKQIPEYQLQNKNMSLQEFKLICWYVLKLGRSEAQLMQARRHGEPRLKRLVTGLMHATYLQVIVGALVAGIDAGRTYTDWPLMGGDVFPALAFELSPWWSNFFENEALVQFNHRLLGYLVFIFGLVVWQRSRSSGNRATKRAYDWVAVMLFGQMVLGVVTVLHAAPVHLALVHQFGAVVLVCLILRARFLTMYPSEQSVRGTA